MPGSLGGNKMGNAYIVSGWNREKLTNCDICENCESYENTWIDKSKSILVCENCKSLAIEEGYEFDE